MIRPNKILVIRRDRLGDLLNTLPALVALRIANPDTEINLYCQSIYRPLIESFLKIHSISLVAEIEWKSYSTAIFLSPNEYRLWMAATLNAVPNRIGNLSHPLSFLFLNRGIRQKRSQNKMSESRYSVELIPNSSFPGGIELPVNKVARQATEEKIKKLGFAPHSFTLLHPGTGGTALNLSAEAWKRIMGSLPKPILISKGPSSIDATLIAKIAPQEPVIEGLSLIELMELIRMAKLLVAPSTGPFHLAHYIGTQSIGLFAPLRAQALPRWQPEGGSGKTNILQPQVICPAKGVCWEERCPHHPCLEKENWIDRLPLLE